jgi:protein Mpv17
VNQKLSLINPTVFLHFVLIALLTTPPNYLWQQFLEDTFPATCPSKKEKSNDGDGMAASEHEKGRLNVANTAVKFLLEQSLGAAANTVIFVIVMGMFKGLSIAEIVLAVRNVSWCFLSRSFSGVQKN